MLRDVARQLDTEVSGQLIRPILKGQAVQKKVLYDWLFPEDGTDDLSRNVGNHVPTYTT